uniref:Coiled-coil SMC6 And NSE5 INteracting (CANIN) domain-containing protein n=1 Tax=Sphenodon punctatus TaxID=8508 RepID=A0A8D0H5G7_SPHPU
MKKWNQPITDFFKPAPKQDGTALCCPERSIKNGDAGRSVMYTERFEKRILSPKKTKRRKMPVPPPNRSPDGLQRGVKKERKDSLSGRPYMAMNAMCPKVVVKKILIPGGSPSHSFMKKDKAINRELERTEKYPIKTRAPWPCENGREQSTEYAGLEAASSNSTNRFSAPEDDTLKKHARGIVNESSTTWCQKTGRPMKLQNGPVNSRFLLSLETYSKERELKKQRKEQEKQQLFSPVKVLLGTSISNQSSGDVLRKRSCSASWESTSDVSSQSMQISKPEVSSPVPSRWSSDKTVSTWKSQSCPSTYKSKTSSGLFKQKEFPGKRKRFSASLDVKSSKPSVAQISNEPYFKSSEKCNSEFLRRTKLPGDGVQQLESAAALSGNVLPLSEGHLHINEVNKKEDSSYARLYFDCTADRNNQISVADTKENRLQLSHSHCCLEQSSLSSQEKSAVKAANHLSNSFSKPFKSLLSSCVQSACSSPALDTKKDMGKFAFCKSDNLTLPSDSQKNSSDTEKTLKDTFNLSSVGISGQPTSFVGTSKTVVRALSFEDESLSNCPSSSCVSSEGNSENSGLEAFMLYRQLRDNSDSESEISDCNLESEEEERLLPLEEILTSNSKPPVETPEKTSIEGSLPGIVTPSYKAAPSAHLAVTQVSSMNCLDNLLKEKEQLKRLHEFEKRLQEDKPIMELTSSAEEQGNSEDKELSEEHRDFLKKFLVINDAIPDYHPGEDLFHLPSAGKLFSEHNLDLRNPGFAPRSPIEKYLLRSNISQQLFVITEGLIRPAYHHFPCPVPLLKWLFQMMSIHSDSFVSKKILDMLMEITIKNGECLTTN